MTLTYKDRRWYKQTALDPRTAYAAETEDGKHLLAILTDGRVTLDGIEVSKPDTLALHDYGPDDEPYPIDHSGDGQCIVADNGYVSFPYMGNGPDLGPGGGTPIYMGVWHKDTGTIIYPMPRADVVMHAEPKRRRGIDNHCRSQVFLREPDKRVVYLAGAHNGTLYAGVSHYPHAATAFQALHPVGPMSTHPDNGHTYPACVMQGDTLHVVSRFLTNGKYQLVYWPLNTLTMQTGEHQVIDDLPEGASYGIWYQTRPWIEGGKLYVSTNRRYRPNDKPDTYLTDPETKTHEVAL